MKDIKVKYAVTNDSLYNEYIEKQNPVTRHTLFNILKRRLDSGDQEAAIHVRAIESMRLTTPPNSPDVKYNDRELLFIATHCMVPYTINRLVKNEIDIPSGMIFDLEGKSHTLDYYDMVRSEDDESPASPEFLVRVIEQYDPDQIMTNKIVNEIFEPLCVASGLTTHEYIKTTQALISYIRENRIDDYVSLENCDIKYILDSLTNLDNFDIRQLANQISKSVTPLCLTYQVSKTNVLELKRSLKGGIRVTDRELKGILLSAREWRDTVCRGDYVIKIKESELKWPTSEWSFVDDDETLLLNIALNIIGLCTTMNNGIERALLQQIELTRNASFDIYIYDKSSPDSIIALGLAVYRNNKARNFKYEFIDVTEEVDLDLFKGKSVCFAGASYDAKTMKAVTTVSRRVFDLGNNTEESVVVYAWRKFIGKPYPFLIKLFDTDSESYIVEEIKRGIERSVNGTVLQTIVPLTEELVKTADEVAVALPPIALKLMSLGHEDEDGLGPNVIDLRIANKPFDI